MLAEVETVFAGEVREQRLPGSSALRADQALCGGEFRERAVHREAGGQFLVEVGSVVAAPGLGADEHVRVERHGVLEGCGGPTPSVDAGVKVESRDTHFKTLRRSGRRCGSL